MNIFERIIEFFDPAYKTKQEVREKNLMSDKIRKAYSKLLADRLDDPKYSRPSMSLVRTIIQRTKRGGGDLIPVRANLDLIVDHREEMAIKLADPSLITPSSSHIGPVFLQSIGCVRKGTLGVISDVDEDYYERTPFIVTWNIAHPQNLKGHVVSHIPVISFVPGNAGDKYQELDFSLINCQPEELGSGFATFIEELWEERRRKWPKVYGQPKRSCR